MMKMSYGMGEEGGGGEGNISIYIFKVMYELDNAHYCILGLLQILDAIFYQSKH